MLLEDRRTFTVLLEATPAANFAFVEVYSRIAQHVRTATEAAGAPQQIPETDALALPVRIGRSGTFTQLSEPGFCK